MGGRTTGEARDELNTVACCVIVGAAGDLCAAAQRELGVRERQQRGSAQRRCDHASCAFGKERSTSRLSRSSSASSAAPSRSRPRPPPCARRSRSRLRSFHAVYDWPAVSSTAARHAPRSRSAVAPPPARCAVASAGNVPSGGAAAACVCHSRRSSRHSAIVSASSCGSDAASIAILCPALMIATGSPPTAARATPDATSSGANIASLRGPGTYASSSSRGSIRSMRSSTAYAARSPVAASVTTLDEPLSAGSAAPVVASPCGCGGCCCCGCC
eukprot:708301-Prymnesium_polylepis.1